MRNYIFITLAIFSFCFINGQQLVTSEEMHNGTPLTITMDSRTAAALAKMETNCNRTVANKSTLYDNKERNADANRPANAIAHRKPTTAEICSKNPKILGYKIQVAIVKSNSEANEIKTNFRKKFPRLKVETDASLRPNYKILAGSYFSKESASSDLKQVKSIYKDAISVQRSIYCAEGK